MTVITTLRSRLEDKLASVLVERDRAIAERDHARAERDEAKRDLAVQEERQAWSQLTTTTTTKPSPDESPLAYSYASPSTSPDAARASALLPLDDPHRDEDEAVALCGDACLGCAEAAGYFCVAAARCGSSIVATGRALYATALSVQHGGLFTLRFVLAALATCHLPPPPSSDGGDDDDGYGSARVSARELPEPSYVVGGLGALAMGLMLLNLFHGGAELAMWVPVGALGGLLGALCGVAFTAVATPTQRGCDMAVLYEHAASVAVAVGGAPALAAAVSGVVAWSVNEYPAAGRANAMWLVNGLLLAAFAVRFGYKTWAGCSARGRLRLLVADGCGCDCPWPVMV